VKYSVISLTHVLELSPLDLKAKLVKQSGRELAKIEKNFVNGLFFGTYQGKLTTIGWLVSEGKVLSKRLPHDNVKRGTFIVYRDGSVAVKMIMDLDKEEDMSKVWFAAQTYNMFPLNLKAEWYDKNQVGYSTWRPVLGYNSTTKKVIIAVRPYSTVERIQQTLKNLGCTIGVGLDGGGSTNFVVDGKAKTLTDRVLTNILYW
jgi:exopolysaccharide biosynthesis protein